MISFGNFGTGKILYSSLKVHCKSPHSWPSSCGKKQFLHSRLRRSWRNCFSPRLLTHSWGDLQCTFRDSQRILNSYTRGFATRIGIFQSQNCQMISLGQWHKHSCGISWRGRQNSIDLYSLLIMFKGFFSILSHHSIEGLRSRKISKFLLCQYLSLGIN